MSKSIFEFKNVFLGELSVFPSWTYFTIGGKCSIMGIIGGWEKGGRDKEGKTTAAVWAICHWIMTPQFKEKKERREKRSCFEMWEMGVSLCSGAHTGGRDANS